jgi:predicted amidophosphoribosyltransferase
MPKPKKELPNYEEGAPVLSCSECKERVDIHVGRFKHCYCGRKIPAAKYPVLIAGCAPYWCPKRPRIMSPFYSGIFYVRMDYADIWRCSSCGKVLTKNSDKMHCPVCELEYIEGLLEL